MVMADLRKPFSKPQPRLTPQFTSTNQFVPAFSTDSFLRNMMFRIASLATLAEVAAAHEFSTFLTITFLI